MGLKYRFTMSDGANTKSTMINCDDYMSMKDLLESITGYKVVNVSRMMYEAVAHTEKKKLKVVLKSRNYMTTIYIPDVDVSESVVHSRIMAQITNFEINGEPCIGIHSIIRTFSNH